MEINAKYERCGLKLLINASEMAESCLFPSKIGRIRRRLRWAWWGPPFGRGGDQSPPRPDESSRISSNGSRMLTTKLMTIWSVAPDQQLWTKHSSVYWNCFYFENEFIKYDIRKVVSEDVVGPEVDKQDFVSKAHKIFTLNHAFCF